MLTKWVKPDILKKGKFKEAVKNVPINTAREFREGIRKKILSAKPSGVMYRRRSGKGFSRSHRASAKGQRFANDSGATLKSLTAQRTGELSASVQFESKTAEYLIGMERIVISAQDEKEGQKLLDSNAAKAIKKLL